jgi:hypothetical protein
VHFKSESDEMRGAKVDAALRAMFDAIAAEPTLPRFLALIEQLERAGERVTQPVPAKIAHRF